MALLDFLRKSSAVSSQGAGPEPPAPDTVRIKEIFRPSAASRSGADALPVAVIQALGGRARREGVAAPTGPAPDFSWLATRIEQLEAALETAGERLHRSLRSQGEIQARAEADRARAEHLAGADERSRQLADTLSRAQSDLAAAQERTRVLDEERSRAEQELARLRAFLSEREAILSRLTREAVGERVALQESLDGARERSAKETAARERAEGEAQAAKEEVLRLSDHLTLREKTLADLSREAAAERERLQAEIGRLHERVEHLLSEHGNVQSQLREDLARKGSEAERLLLRDREISQSLSTEREHSGVLAAKLESLESRAGELAREQAGLWGEREGLRAQIAQLEAERARLSAHIKEREDFLEREALSARAEREAQAQALERAREEAARAGREHERILSEKSRLESELSDLGRQGARDKERGETLAAQALLLEERLRSLQADLSAASAREEAAREEARRHKALEAELAERARKAELEARAARSAWTELERRAEAAESLVRERLKAPPAAAPPRTMAPSLAGEGAGGDISRRLESIEGQTQRLVAELSRGAPPGTSPQAAQLAERLAGLEKASREIGEKLQGIAAGLSAAPAAAGPPPSEAAGAAAPQFKELDALRKKIDQIAAGTSGRKEPSRPQIAVAAGLLAVLLGGALLGIYWRLSRQLDESREIIARWAAGAGGAAGALAQPRLKSPPAGSELSLERADLRGEAKGADAVFLFLNGSLYAVGMAKGGKFSFEQVPLEPGKNQIGLKSVAQGGAGSDLWEGGITRTAAQGQLASLTPTPSGPRDFLRGALTRREIALTFDGDDAGGAQDVLATLARNHIQTTVFLTGEFVERHPEVTRQIVAAGHEAGNHSWDHPHLTTFDQNNRHDTRPEISKSYFQSQLIRTASKFEEVTGERMAPLWRAPFGEVNSELMRWAEELGYRHINWTRDYSRGKTLDSLDWVTDPGDRNYYANGDIVKRLLDFGAGTPSGASGGIVLMHLNTKRPPGQSLHDKLQDLIGAWRQQGYQFVKVSRMLAESEKG